MLAAIGLDRHAEDPDRAVLITNVIFWRPPGNRKPTEAETLMCLPFVQRTIALVRPRLIVALGAIPAQRLLGTTQGILKLRGRWTSVSLDGETIALMPSLHPAYLLRQPAQKRLAWRDFLAVRERLDSTA
jgi:DNA polymerase